MEATEFAMEVMRVVRVVVTHYVPAYAGRYAGPPEACEPPEPAQFECQAFDERGREVALTREEEEEAQERYEAFRNARVAGPDHDDPEEWWER